MMKGELIYKNSTESMYTDAMPRGANRGVFAVNVRQVSGSFAALTVNVQHKNRDEASWATAQAITFPDPFVSGLYSEVAGPLKEQVRMEIKQTGGDWMRVEVLETEWL